MSAFIIASLFVCSTFLVISILLIVIVVHMSEQRSHLLPSDLLKYEMIVVLGAHVTPKEPCPELASRLDHALYIHQKILKPIAVSGGYSGCTSEIKVMSDYLQARGLSPKYLMYLVPSNSTISTISCMAKHEQICWWLVVSSPYHSARLHYLAFKQGLNIYTCCPILAKATSAYLVKQRMRETMAILREICLDVIGVLGNPK